MSKKICREKTEKQKLSKRVEGRKREKSPILNMRKLRPRKRSST